MSALVHRYLAGRKASTTGNQFLATNGGGRYAFVGWAVLVSAPIHVGKKLFRRSANWVRVRTVDSGLLEIFAIFHASLHLKGF
jgi:hypothetical protein